MHQYGEEKHHTLILPNHAFSSNHIMRFDVELVADIHREWATNERDKRAHAGRVIKRGVCGECPVRPMQGLADMRPGHKPEMENNLGLFI